MATFSTLFVTIIYISISTVSLHGYDIICSKKYQCDLPSQFNIHCIYTPTDRVCNIICSEFSSCKGSQYIVDTKTILPVTYNALVGVLAIMQQLIVLPIVNAMSIAHHHQTMLVNLPPLTQITTQ